MECIDCGSENTIVYEMFTDDDGYEWVSYECEDCGCVFGEDE